MTEAMTKMVAGWRERANRPDAMWPDAVYAQCADELEAVLDAETRSVGRMPRSVEAWVRCAYRKPIQPGSIALPCDCGANCDRATSGPR